MVNHRKNEDENGADESRPRRENRPSSAPDAIAPAWQLTQLDCEHIDAIYGVSYALAQLHLDAKIHTADRQFLFDGLASAIAFSKLSQLIKVAEFSGQSKDFIADLHDIRIGFALAHRAIDNALDERVSQLEKPLKSALKMHASNAATQEMKEVKHIFLEWQSGKLKFKNDADFARQMTKRFESIKNAVSIQNSCRKWRNEIKSS